MKLTRPGPLEVKRGEVILVEGDTGKEMYIIEEGRVEIYRKAGEGEQALALLEAGDFFGEMGLLDDQPRAASARAAEDAKLLLIDHTTFDQMLRQYPEVSIRIMRSLCQRLRAAAAAAVIPPAAKEPGPPKDFVAAILAGEASESEPSPATPEPAAAAPEPPPAAEGAPEPPPAAEAPPAPPQGRLLPKPRGAEIPLPEKAEIRLGRFDSVTKTEPDVDLAPFDKKRLTSRRHAKILREEGRLFVFEEIGTANGTFVNGKKIATGVKVEIGDGDELRFGGVTFVLRLP
jgi:hypothetical protein